MNTYKKFVVSLALLVISSVTLYPFTFSAQAAGNTLDIWWPTDGAQVSGTQPLKAMVEGTPVEQYDMYWQVDGGQLNPMQNNYTDYPHKEVAIDLANWNWHGQGPYVLTLIAKQNGAVIVQRSVSIYNVGATASAPAPVAAPAPAPSPAPTQQVQTAAVSVPAAAGSVQVWWPTASAQVSGVQPFKAMVPNLSVEQYDMYWQVDGGSLNPMQNNYTDYPHKEANVDLSSWQWQQSGTYTITFVAKQNGVVLAQTQEPIVVNKTQSSASTIAAPAALTVSVSAPTATISSNDPLSGSFYVNPNSNAARQEQQWAQSRPSDAAAMQLLAAQPTANWFGSWNQNIYNDVHQTVTQAANAGAVPVLVAYDIPLRDCSGGYSSGGVNSPSGYQSWIGSFASAIGQNKAVVILEPDALADMNCLSSGDQQTRLSLLSDAVSALKQNSNTAVYIDAGHPGWVDAGTMASRLSQAGISRADGFALNVSNFDTTSNNASYGSQISQQLGGKHFVIDTSRNGDGSNGQWCNPSGRAIGASPTAATGNSLIDAYLWVKAPGESDGSCQGGPSAGTWWADYALSLVNNR